MTISITIRDLPNETRDVLAARAARSGRSLQEYLSRELRLLAARPSVDEALDTIRGRARAYPQLDAADVLSDLEADRR
ncbi:MAG: hypothetical protein ABIR17_08990 [Pseudolysinimonas sp.]|uniref:FitA-like ribbon-helix-helix domain-containing protein n=1 Tax=Pseudolysinimonas sp. TaxID=2680009 RepID=UPI003263D46E